MKKHKSIAYLFYYSTIFPLALLIVFWTEEIGAFSVTIVIFVFAIIVMTSRTPEVFSLSLHLVLFECALIVAIIRIGHSPPPF